MKVPATLVQQDLQSGKRVALIDVRTPVEHDDMHIAGSVLMPLDQLDPEAVKSAAKGADRCVLICQSGARAERALQKLKAAGCEDIVILDGGVNGWQTAGLELNHGERKRLPLMRQVQLIIGLVTLTSSLLALVVDRNFALVPAFFGAGLTLAGATGWCGLAILMSKMPWNKVECGGCKVTSCSV